MRIKQFIIILIALSVVVSCRKPVETCIEKKKNLLPIWTVESNDTTKSFMSLIFPYKANTENKSLVIVVEKKRKKNQPNLLTLGFSSKGLVTNNAAIVLRFTDAKCKIDSSATVASFYQKVDNDNCIVYFNEGMLESDGSNVFKSFITHDYLICSLPKEDGSVEKIKLPLESFRETYKQLP